MKPALLYFLLFITSFCFSQRTITGTVSDADGEPIYDAIIIVKGSKIYTVTDFDGNYSIEAKSTDTLVFSYTGYDSQDSKVLELTMIDIFLKPALDIVLFYQCFPYSNRLYTVQGLNYNTYGLSFENDYNLLPHHFNFDLLYSTDFKNNSNFKFGLEKDVRFSDSFYLNVRASFETANFNNLQYHSYKLNLEKSVHLFSKTNYEEIQIIGGYINYDGLTKNKNFGYGAGFKKSILRNVKLGTSFIHWQEFNEFNANASYNWRRWNISGNYKHLANYEEFQVGLGYSFYF